MCLSLLHQNANFNLLYGTRSFFLRFYNWVMDLSKLVCDGPITCMVALKEYMNTDPSGRESEESNAKSYGQMNHR